MLNAVSHLTEQQVNDVKHHVERKLGCEEREEPLGGVHVRFQTYSKEVRVQIWNVFLQVERERNFRLNIYNDHTALGFTKRKR